MKKILIPVLVAVASVLPMRAQTILVVDVSGVFNNSIEVKDALNSLNSTAATYRDYLNKMAADLQKLQTDAQALQAQIDNTLTPAESRETYRQNLAAKNADIEKAKGDMQDFYNRSDTLIKNRQTSLVQTELEKIKTASQEIAAKRKSTLVLNSSALGMLQPVIFSGDKSVDISDEVLKMLNDAATASAPASATTPATMAAPASTGAVQILTPNLPSLTPKPAMGSGAK